MLLRLGQGFSAHHSRPAADDNGPAYLDSVLASTVMDLDATIADSYPGTGTTWSNLTASPADGSAQTAYDFYLGDGSTSSTYPTFTGTAGNQAAYWAFDGGDYFRLKSGTNTAFINALHKTTGGADFWIVFAYGAADDTYSSANGIMGTQPFSGSGIEMDFNSSETFRFQQRGTVAGAAQQNSTSSGLGAGANIIIASYSHSSGQLTTWQSAATGVTYSLTFKESVADAAQPLEIGALGGGQYPIDAEKTVYAFAMGNEYLDDSQAAAIIAHLETRHGRAYTP